MRHSSHNKVENFIYFDFVDFVSFWICLINVFNKIKHVVSTESMVLRLSYFCHLKNITLLFLKCEMNC